MSDAFTFKVRYQGRIIEITFIEFPDLDYA